MARPEIRVGTSGWQYDHWRGVLYPEGMPRRAWFDRYAEVFDTVEVNNCFYRLPEPGTFARWREQAPTGFCYALKYSRFGTHRKKLLDPEQHVPPFVERARLLGPHLGPVLVQLPPRWRPDPGRIEAFLEALPGDLRWVFEFRDPRWLTGAVFSLLSRHGAGLCLHDMVPDHPEVVTADLVYLRFHGGGYDGCYSSDQLSAVARRVQVWAAHGLDVFAYFNNDLYGHAVRNALELAGRVAVLTDRTGPARPEQRLSAAGPG